MTYAIQTTQKVCEELRAEQFAHENAVVDALCRAIEAAMDPDGQLSSDKARRRHVQDCHLETAAVVMGMSMGAGRHMIAVLVSLVAIWRDLTTSTPQDRLDAGELLRSAVPFIRRSRGIA